VGSFSRFSPGFLLEFTPYLIRGRNDEEEGIRTEVDLKSTYFRNPSPSRDCVVIMMKERFGRDRQSGSSALECGHLELWVIELIPDAIFLRACSPVDER
jgi:hypothetical protein